MSAAPAITTARRIPSPAARAWSHDPAAQVTAAADSAIPPRVTLPPRNSTTVSGTNASVPKNAKAMAKTATVTDGRPRASRRLPGGRRWPRTQAASDPPPATSATAGSGEPTVSPESASVEPMARRTASMARRASLRAGSPVRSTGPMRRASG